jgi:hypothetical protein
MTWWKRFRKFLGIDAEEATTRHTKKECRYTDNEKSIRNIEVFLLLEKDNPKRNEDLFQEMTRLHREKKLECDADWEELMRTK